MITAIIVDDELMARNALAAFINAFAKEVEIVGEAHSLESAVMEIQQTQPDLIFLDYQMGDGTGQDVLKCFPNLDSKVIFVSANPQEAHKLFEYDVLAFLVKPLHLTTFRAAIEKYKKELAEEERIAELERLANPPKPVTDHIFVPEGDVVRSIKVAEIMRCEGKRNNTILYMVNNEQIKISRSLKRFESFLVGHPFFRVHRSHVLHFPFIDKIYKTYRGRVEMHNGDKIPVTVDLLTELQSLYPDKFCA